MLKFRNAAVVATAVLAAIMAYCPYNAPPANDQVASQSVAHSA